MTVTVINTYIILIKYLSTIQKYTKQTPAITSLCISYDLVLVASKVR